MLERPKSRIEARDDKDLSQLDALNFDVARSMLENANLRAIFLGVREESLQDIKSLERMSESPTSFDDMLDTSTGTVYQRMAKFFLKTGDPVKAKQFLEVLGVQKYRSLILGTIGRLSKPLHQSVLDKGENTNYFLAGRSDSHLLDFAIKQCSFNELIHIAGALVALGLATTETTWEDASIHASVFLLNIYCILTQRLTRAELAILINKKLERGSLDLDTYMDKLNLRLPNPKN